MSDSVLPAHDGREVQNGRLAGKRALVTGAGTGIGRGVAMAFAAEGARVALVGRRPAVLISVEEEIRARSGEAISLAADVSNEGEIAGAIVAAERAFGGLDTIVGVAGIELASHGDDRVDALTLEAWQQTVDVNMTGMFLTCKHGARALLRNGAGSIIITGSPTGILGHATRQHAYSASKAGCHGLVRVMAADYANDNIRVNCVIPGFVQTPLTEFVFDDPLALAAAVRPIPMLRSGRPEEIAPMMVLLASDESSYTTGAFFIVDGGHSAV